MSNAVDNVTTAVADLEAAMDGLLGACTDPQGMDVAELYAAVSEARVRLQGLERDAEAATARAMLGDYAETPTLRVERSRRADRKAWDHEGWQADVRHKVLQAAGLKGAQGVINAAGEVLDASVLHDLMAAVEGVHGSTAPRVTAMRQLGIDPDDYCERTPGGWQVKVTRLADETEEGAA